VYVMESLFCNLKISELPTICVKLLSREVGVET
jgi:hypothetical protein